MTNLPQQPILLGQFNLKFRAPKRPHSNKSTTPTLNPLRVDRDPALRGAGLFAVAPEVWRLGAVTPGSWTEVFGAVAVLRHGGSHKLNCVCGRIGAVRI